MDMSLPTRECGLKSYLLRNVHDLMKVTPPVGVRIEMYVMPMSEYKSYVTPRVGAWIEIFLILFLRGDIIVHLTE